MKKNKKNHKPTHARLQAAERILCVHVPQVKRIGTHASFVEGGPNQHTIKLLILILHTK